MPDSIASEIKKTETKNPHVLVYLRDDQRAALDQALKRLDELQSDVTISQMAREGIRVWCEKVGVEFPE
jgi:hypothetical protein